MSSHLRPRGPHGALQGFSHSYPQTPIDPTHPIAPGGHGSHTRPPGAFAASQAPVTQPGFRGSRRAAALCRVRVPGLGRGDVCSLPTPRDCPPKPFSAGGDTATAGHPAALRVPPPLPSRDGPVQGSHCGMSHPPGPQPHSPGRPSRASGSSSGRSGALRGPISACGRSPGASAECRAAAAAGNRLPSEEGPRAVRPRAGRKCRWRRWGRPGGGGGGGAGRGSCRQRGRCRASVSPRGGAGQHLPEGCAGTTPGVGRGRALVPGVGVTRRSPGVALGSGGVRHKGWGKVRPPPPRNTLTAAAQRDPRSEEGAAPGGGDRGCPAAPRRSCCAAKTPPRGHRVPGW